MNRPIRRHPVLLMTTAAVLAAAAACSSGKSTSGSNASATTGAPAATGSSQAPMTSAAGSPAAGTSGSAGTGSAVASICAAGEKEGEVDIARGTDADVFAKEIAPFEQKYPGIKVKYTSLKPQDNAQRILAEAQTEHALDEDGTDYDLPTATPLIQQGLIDNVDWASLGIPNDLLLTQDGVTVARSDLILLGLTYDKSKTDPSTLPSTWNDLVNSKWAGQVIVDPRGKYLAPLSIVWGEQQTLDWYKKFLSTDKPVIVNGATASLQKVVDGEAKLSVSAHDAEVNQLNAGGANAGIKYLDVIPTDEDFVLIYKKAPHPNAIRCFYAWRLSQEGLAQTEKYEFKGDSVPSDLPAGSKLAANLTPDQTALVTKVAGELAKLTQ